jgi:putative ABC transport system permease protein
VAEHFGSISGGGVVAKFKLPDGDTLPELEAPHFGLGDSAYFRALGFRVLTGRRLDARDRAGTDPVAVIGESMARQYWPGRDPLGACFYTIWPGQPPCRRVVGIVHDIRHGVSTQPRALYFIPASQYPWPSHGSFAVRTRGRASASTVAAIQPIIAQLAAGTRAPTVRRMVDVLDPQLHPWKVAAALFLLFGALALVSAASGVYGLAAYDVTQRTREIGVRIALGATARSVLGLVLGSGVRVVLLGVGVGVAAAVASGRVMASLLYDTSPYDPTVLATTALTLLGVAFLAGLIPAWRATRVDPVIALRAE